MPGLVYLPMIKTLKSSRKPLLSLKAKEKTMKS